MARQIIDRGEIQAVDRSRPSWKNIQIPYTVLGDSDREERVPLAICLHLFDLVDPEDVQINVADLEELVTRARRRKLMQG